MGSPCDVVTKVAILSERIRTPVLILRSFSDEYSWDKYLLTYHLSYRITTVIQLGWLRKVLTFADIKLNK